MKLFALILVSALIAHAQNEPVFRTGVSLVRVDAEAVDASGRVVPATEPGEKLCSELGPCVACYSFRLRRDASLGFAL